MSADLLFEHFATLATAPDGIARLRELFLQLAVQGKLGTHDNEEDLGKWKTGKISDFSKSKDESVQTGPFGAQLHSYDYVQEGIPLILIKNVKNGEIIERNIPRISPSKANELKRYRLKKGDIVFSRVGSVGRVAVVQEHQTGWLISGQMLRVRLDNPEIDSKFLQYLIQTKWFSEHLEKEIVGTTRRSINSTILRNLPLIKPPLDEQHRIVAKVDRLMALCDELEAHQQQERAGCLRLGTASLAGLQNAESPEEFRRQWGQVCDAFELILDCPENVAVLRQTILQLAVQGRLVRQEPGDEPARVLEEKIRKEKVRLVKEGKIPKERDLEPVLEAEIPFTLPINWIWVKWNDISLQIQDVDHRMPTACSEGIPYISPRDFGPNNKIHFDTAKKISKADFDSLKTKIQPEKNDIIFPRYGTIGENRFIETDIEFLASYSCTTIKTLTGFVNPKYTFYFSISPLVRSQIEKSINKTTQANVGLKSIQNYLFPLPPLAEQHRIVAKVDALMAFCDALESQLKERAGVQARYSGSIVKNIAGSVQ